MKRTIALLLCLCVLAGSASALAADVQPGCVVLGTDLTPEQRQQVYTSFGITPESVTELTLTDEEGTSLLAGLLEESLLGEFALSCVYVEALPEGSGTVLQTENTTWCTEEMYLSALTTAGVTDVRVTITAPEPVPGASALAGIYKGYETVTGVPLGDSAKALGARELVLTSELADQLGEFDAALLVAELKSILNVTRTMTDEELSAQIRELGREHSITLNDTQVQMLLDLCRKFEALGEGELAQRVEQLQNTVEKLRELAKKAKETTETLSEYAEKAGGFLSRLKELWDSLLG